MWNRTSRPSASLAARWLLGVGLLAGLLPISAAAQEQIQSIRLGRHPDYQRIVLEVPGAVEAYTTGEPERIEIAAEPPALAPRTRDQLAALGVRLEGSGAKTRIVLEPGALRPWRAFRLQQGAPRIVVDLGPGAPSLPDDAEVLPEVAAAQPPVPSDAGPAGPDVSAIPPAPDPPRPLKETAERPDIRVRVEGLDLVGLPEKGPTRDDILALGLSLRRAPNGDWEAANGANDAQKVSLRELTSRAGAGPALRGSVLQHVVERIAAVYADRGLYGTRVDIRQTDVDRLIDRGGPLVVHVRPNPAATGDAEVLVDDR